MKLVQVILAIIVVLYAFSCITEREEINQLPAPAVRK